MTFDSEGSSEIQRTELYPRYRAASEDLLENDVEGTGPDSEPPSPPSKSRKKPCRLFLVPQHKLVLLQAIISAPPFAKDDRSVNQRWQSVVDRIQETELSPLRFGAPIYSGVTVRNARSAWEAMAQDHKRYLREKTAATGIIGEGDRHRCLINMAYKLEQEALQQRTSSLNSRKRAHETHLQNNRNNEALRAAAISRASALSRAARKRSSGSPEDSSSENSSSSDTSQQRKIKRTRDINELRKLFLERKEYLDHAKAMETGYRAIIKEILRIMQQDRSEQHAVNRAILEQHTVNKAILELLSKK
ncbi:hypothetical protein BX616_001605 [Lobosporangium transversale]|nr:hypothetical protein BX616_001605 [Lobosporangium transversale]